MHFKRNPDFMICISLVGKLVDDDIRGNGPSLGAVNRVQSRFFSRLLLFRCNKRQAFVRGASSTRDKVISS